ncbi:uncharacterized protein LOC132703093 [Cylas formicarius]|uniref:uncharacterized protein LOC132703093 n=1 Tax=Cylas formicarius TaxID=197179 RepID=UPI002958D629|nr:uncharacterized protein LOC132703093 [Cylas formicarius]
MGFYSLLLVLSILTYVVYAQNCKGIKIECKKEPRSCPKNQTLIASPCSCGCKTCKPAPWPGAEGSRCIVVRLDKDSSNGCNEKLKCCDGACFKPEKCCTKDQLE